MPHISFYFLFTHFLFPFPTLVKQEKNQYLLCFLGKQRSIECLNEWTIQNEMNGILSSHKTRLINDLPSW